MTDTKNTGGPAFPVTLDHETARDERMHPIISEGMTIRDYFAAKAMHALITKQGAGDPHGQADAAAEWAYVHADAMLKAREQ